MERNFLEPIRIEGDGKELAKLLGGEFKPYSTPLFSKEEIEKAGIIDFTKVDLDEFAFRFPTPKK